MRRHALPWMCALAALAAVPGGCSKSSSGGAESETKASADRAPAAGAGPTKLTVAAIAVVDVAPLYLAGVRGFFAEEGLEVTVQSTQGGAESVPGVVSGQYPIAFANVVSILLAHAKGLPLKVIAAGNFSTGKAEDFGAVVVPAGSPVKALKELEGKTVSVNQINNIGGVTVRAAMRKAGGDPDQIKLIELPFPQMPAALGQGRVDAAWLVEPFLTVARSQGATVIDWNFADAAPSLMIAAYITTADYARSHPDVVRRFVAAIDKALAYASEHPDDARAILPTYTKIDPAIAGKLNLPVWTPRISRESIRALGGLMVQDKLVAGPPDVDALLR